MMRMLVLQEIRKMRFKEVYAGWRVGRLAQAASTQFLVTSERSFRLQLSRYEAGELVGLID